MCEEAHNRKNVVYPQESQMMHTNVTECLFIEVTEHHCKGSINLLRPMLLVSSRMSSSGMAIKILKFVVRYSLRYTESTFLFLKHIYRVESFLKSS